jgi:hypothetical protein
VNKKTAEAWITGFLAWVLGVMGIVLFGTSPYFSAGAIVTVLVLTGPFSYLLTRFHLRDVGRADWGHTAIRFGIIITWLQFPLDALGWLAITSGGFLGLSVQAQQTIATALPIAYFWLLGVPWWMGVKAEKRRGG